MTLLKKSPAPSENENIVVICKKNTPLTGFGLSALEIDYAKHEFEKKNKKVAVINQLRRIVIVHLLEKKEKEGLTLEACRKSGDKIAVHLNDSKKESVVVVDAVGDAKATLAFAEGIALSNYQFIKYKTKDFEKDKHTLKTVFINSKKIILIFKTAQQLPVYTKN